MTKLIRLETREADEVYFGEGYIQLIDDSEFWDNRVFIDIRKRVDGDDPYERDEEGAMRLANLFLAAEDLLAALKQEHGETGKDCPVCQLITRAEGRSL